MQITYMVTEQEFFHSFRLHCKAQSVRHTLKIIVRIFVALIDLAFLYVSFSDGANFINDNLIACIGIAISNFFVFAYTPLILRLAAHRQYQNQPLAHSEITVDFAADGLHTHMQAAEGFMQWSAHIRWLEDKELFLINRSPDMFSHFPKRAMTEEQIVELSAMLTDKIGPMGVVRKVAK